MILIYFYTITYVSLILKNIWKAILNISNLFCSMREISKKISRKWDFFCPSNKPDSVSRYVSLWGPDHSEPQALAFQHHFVAKRFRAESKKQKSRILILIIIPPLSLYALCFFSLAAKWCWSQQACIIWGLPRLAICIVASQRRKELLRLFTLVGGRVLFSRNPPDCLVSVTLSILVCRHTG